MWNDAHMKKKKKKTFSFGSGAQGNFVVVVENGVHRKFFLRAMIFTRSFSFGG